MGKSSRRFCLPTALLLIMVMGTLAISCGGEAHDLPEGTIGVVVTLLPQAEFMERIGGNNVDVTVMVPPGVSPHIYEPTPSQMVAVAKAEMYAKVGSPVEFELTWMDKLVEQNRDMLVVDCSKGIEMIKMTPQLDESGSDNVNGSLDPHIWMSPRNAMIMVRNMCDGLEIVDPERKKHYEANRDAYLDELELLDHEIQESLAGVNNGAFMVYHPAFGYLARDYGLTMLPIENEGKEPTPAGLKRLIDQAREYNVRVIFVEPQFDPSGAKVIADEIGATVVRVDPLAKDYIGNLRTIAKALAEGIN